MTAVLEDPLAPHQIHLMQLQCATGMQPETAVTCTCTARPGSRGGRPAYLVIEARSPFPAADAIAAWRAWHADWGVSV